MDIMPKKIPQGEKPSNKPWYLSRKMKWLYSLALLAGLTYAGLYQYGLYLLANPQYVMV